MHPGVAASFASGDRLLSRARALDLGVEPSTIASLVRSGAWVIVRRGVYVDGEHWRSLDEYVGRPRLRSRAVVRSTRRGWRLSHDSAAHELGMGILRPQHPLVHLTRPGFTGAWTEYGVAHHLARFTPDQVVQIDGLEVLDLARTAVDIARERGEVDGIVACDAAMRMGVPRSALVAAYEPMRSWPGVTAARAAVDFADPGAQTVHESLGRILLAEAGFTNDVETQFPLQTGRGVIWCDLRVGNHVVETDGRIKYRPRADGGVAEKPLDEVIWDEKVRERLIREEGLGVSRLLWPDYWGERRAIAIAALQADVRLTIERHGPDLSPRLARQAAAIRAAYSA